MADRRTAVGAAMAVLNRLSSARVLDRLKLRRPVERAVFHATKTGFQAQEIASRSFTAARRLAAPSRPSPPAGGELFDLSPTEEQQLIRDTVADFAAEGLRPAAAQADRTCEPPPDLLAAAGELGVTAIGVPEELGGTGAERAAVTNVLVAEALAHGDMGLAVACLAPAGVSTALTLWGDADQQSTYLPAFTGHQPPVAAVAIQEPRPLFDPFSLRTKAYRTPSGFRLSGVKSLVPRAAAAELLVVAADLDGRGPALFLVESGGAGVTVEVEPAMGLRAATLSTVEFDNVALPENALLGEGSGGVYADCVRLGRLGWCALAIGTSAAVLEYVIRYVNEREAFGEPVSHRQGVAFPVATMGTEVEGMRLLTYRAAARAERGMPFAREAALAHTLCAGQGMRIGSDGVQLLGGHGYVKEHPVERWYRDLRAIGLMEGVLLV